MVADALELPSPRGRGPLRVVIVGGGVGALEAVLALRDLAEERVEITLLCPDSEFRYRPASVAVPFGRGEVRRFALSDIAAVARPLQPSKSQVGGAGRADDERLHRPQAQLAQRWVMVALSDRAPRPIRPQSALTDLSESVRTLGSRPRTQLPAAPAQTGTRREP